MAPDGQDHPATDVVFGDEVGEQITSVKKAWATAVLRAHVHTPPWPTGGVARPASHAVYRAVHPADPQLGRHGACGTGAIGWQSAEYRWKRYYVWPVRDGDVIRGKGQTK